MADRTPNPWFIRLEAGPRVGVWALLALVSAGAAGCPFGPSIPVEEGVPNMPPMISEDALSPNTFEYLISRSDPPPVFSVNNFLDPNDSERLEVLWFSHNHRVTNLLKSESAIRDQSETNLERGVFHVYTGSDYQLAPCGLEWADDRTALTVLVADGAVAFPDDEPVMADGVFSDSFTWSLTFDGACE
jgi:hypothetical protein